MIGTLIYLFLMCIIIRCIKTIQDITRIAGHKKTTSVLIALDTLFFLFVFKNVITNDITWPIVLAISAGYIVGYYLGSFIEEKMALGKVIVTIKIAKTQSIPLSKILKENGFVFIRSKRFYSHKGKLRKLYQGIVYRKELPKLKKITKEYNIIATIENIKETFGKEPISAKDYLKMQKE